MRKYLKESEMDRLIEAARTPRDKLIFKLLYETGMRISELAKLQISDIDFELNEITIQHAKRHYEGRKVPLINDSTINRLKNHIGTRTTGYIFPGETNKHYDENKPLRRQQYWNLVKGAARRANLDTDKVHPHTIRHAHAVHALQSGIDLRTLQLNLGHTDIATTAIYTGMDLDDIKKEYRSKWTHSTTKLPTPPPAPSPTPTSMPTGIFLTPDQLQQIIQAAIAANNAQNTAKLTIEKVEQ